MRILLLAITLWFSGNVLGQNWKPLNLTDIYNYQADTAAVITHSLWVDSFNIIAGDTLYFPNRIVKEVSASVALKNQPQFLGVQLLVGAAGNYNWKSDSVNAAIPAGIALNQTFVFDSLNNIDGTVISEGEDTILGIGDSVKVILLSSNDTVIISKEHGLIQYPIAYGTGQYYRLVGIEGGRNLGKHVLKLADIFNYTVGDTFWYYYRDNYIEIGFPGDNIIDKRKKTLYVIDEITYRTNDTIYYGRNTDISSYTGDKFLVAHPQADVNLYPNTIDTSYIELYATQNAHYYPYYNLNFFWGIPDHNAMPNCNEDLYAGFESFLRADGRVAKGFRKFYCDKSNAADSLGYGIGFQHNSVFHREFSERLGLVEMETMGFERNSYAKMYAYRLAGDTTVTILDQGLNDLVIGVEVIEASDFYKLLSNPVQDRINVQMAMPSEGGASLYSISGEKILQQPYDGKDVEIDVSFLPQGIYVLEILGNGYVKRERIVKL